MGKKYLDTKSNSLESSILGIWEQEATRMGRIKKEKLTAKQKKLDVDGDGEIEGSDLAKLRKKAKKESFWGNKNMWTDAMENVYNWNLEEGEMPKAALDALKKSGKDITKKKGEKKEDNKKTDTGKKVSKVVINPDIEMKEGRMKELHGLIKQGKSAEEIAKIMKVDVKTVKSLMSDK